MISAYILLLSSIYTLLQLTNRKKIKHNDYKRDTKTLNLFTYDSISFCSLYRIHVKLQ